MTPEERRELQRQWSVMTPAEQRLARSTGFRPFGIKDRKTLPQRTSSAVERAPNDVTAHVPKPVPK